MFIESLNEVLKTHTKMEDRRGAQKKMLCDKVGQSVLGNHKTHYYYSIETALEMIRESILSIM